MSTEISADARWFWAHVAFGSAGVIAVSACYILSPSLAVSPNLGADISTLQAAALTDTGSMRMAGILGVVADPFITIGALGLAHQSVAAGKAREAAGFYWLAAAALIYTIADAFVGFGLKPAAQGGLGAFSAVKPLFDSLLSGASVGYGLSGVLIGWPSRTQEGLERVLKILLTFVGIQVAGAGLVCILGVGGPAGLVLGAGLTELTILYTIIGVRGCRSRSDGAASIKDMQIPQHRTVTRA